MSPTTPPPGEPTVTVCRGCCCGTATKRPLVDHAARLEALRRLLDGTARVRVTDCLGPCERSDVMVVSPSPEGRRSGGRPVWLGQVNGRHEPSALADWVAAGGPGLADVPESLRRAVFRSTDPLSRP
ncbi:(2Fe-2S) ferredoxin domain-containing protein [Nocardioides sp. 503]|uniref:(2Fe-2S) ferredoxin domain-containing protein n=1 Tax=Nocardioides sp. 503 TaxID=2508326 RepID=UPI00106F9DCA|nr:(2Fe-2S) ferredoxin domain-containing protein [Nocardioides sp. 503]